MPFNRTIEDVIAKVERAQGDVYVLLGAGMSVSAGIPLASTIVKDIEKKYPRDFDRAKTKDYPQVMGELSPDLRRTLISGYIKNAKLNWAHIALAELIKKGHLSRIYTTNFDPLIAKACNQTNQDIAIYDLAVSHGIDDSKIANPALLHLHGQNLGFVILNTESEVTDLGKKVSTLFNNAHSHTWLVVGYSGDQDAVISKFINIPCFEHELFWIGYNDHPPPPLLKQKFADNSSFAHYINGYDADRFFIELARGLGAFPPHYLDRPFSHIKDRLADITPFPIADHADADPLKTTRLQLDKAIAQFETNQSDGDPSSAPSGNTKADSLSVLSQFLKGDYLTLIHQYEANPSAFTDHQDIIAQAYFALATDKAIALSKASSPPAANDYHDILGWFHQATTIKPDFHEAWYNWGLALQNWAKTQEGEAQDTAYRSAFDKYQKATTIKPDFYDAWNNWGLALQNWAKTQEGEAQEKAYRSAFDKYQKATTMNPNDHETWTNWGIALLAYYHLHKRADVLVEAEEKLNRAFTINEKECYNLACVYALKGQNERCQAMLEKALQYGTLPNKAHLQEDDDLACVRPEAWFTAIWAQAPD